MGKRTRQREAERRAEEQALCRLLQTRTDARPGFISSYAEFAPHYRDKIELYRRFANRAPEDWTSSVRVRSPERRFLDLVKFVFARYPVARHLELAWTETPATTADADTEAGCVVFEQGRADRCLWYILAAQGQSLHREGLQNYISKRETHYFVTAPDEIVSTTRAFWYAVAMAANADAEVAERVSRTKLAGYPAAWKFWKDVARFFARNPLPVLEMNDFIDYFQAARDLDDGFEVHGRTLASLRRRKEEWHRELRDAWTFDSDRWPGRPIPDAVYRTETENGPAVWRMHQITDANELYREGERMHHCVMSYKSRFMESMSSIWSLTCEHPIGTFHRGLTVEVDENGQIMQCRGFANREALDNENAILSRWARDYGLAM
jgi:PcfJ-like protein